MECKKRINIVKKIFLFLALLSSVGFAQKEHQIEAVFLAKFTNFVTWPEESNINDTSKPFVITVIGNSPIKEFLKNIFDRNGQKIKNKKVELRFIQKIDKIDDCDILFISENMSDSLENILKVIEGKPILTISDSEGYGERGVLINFYVTDNLRLHFEINYEKVKRSKISISSRLLKNAKIVGGGL